MSGRRGSETRRRDVRALLRDVEAAGFNTRTATTCFVLKSLVKIDQLTGLNRCDAAIKAGIDCYIRRLFSDEGLPKPFATPPRLIVFRGTLRLCRVHQLGKCREGARPDLDALAANRVKDLLTNWRKRDGSFNSRKLLFGWDRVPMHRWRRRSCSGACADFLSREPMEISNVSRRYEH